MKSVKVKHKKIIIKKTATVKYVNTEAFCWFFVVVTVAVVVAVW